MSTQDFESLKERLDQIVEAVKDDDLPIEQALSLYEEAVSLGLKASSLLEESVFPHEDADDNAQSTGATSAPQSDSSSAEHETHGSDESTSAVNAAEPLEALSSSPASASAEQAL